MSKTKIPKKKENLRSKNVLEIKSMKILNIRKHKKIPK